MRSTSFPLRLMAACLLLSGVAFAKPVIQVTSDSDGFVLHDYSFKVGPEGTKEIELSLSAADAEKLRQLTRKSLDKRVNIAIGGTEVLMPVVKDVISGKELKLSFTDQETFAAVQKALAK